MPKILIEGVRVHYREQGEGPVAVLLHSGGGTSSQWRGVADNLSERYRLVMPDFYGFGEAEPWPGPPEQRTHERDAQLIRGLITQLGMPVHIVGHSLGGAVALRLVLKNSSDILSMTLIEPGSAYAILRHGGEPQLYKELCEVSEKMIARLEQGKAEEAWQVWMDWSEGPGTWDTFSAGARRRLCEVGGGSPSIGYSNLNDNTTLAECAAITVPTLAIFGASTNHVWRRLTEIVAENIPGCQLESIGGAGHPAPITHPAEAAQLLEHHFRVNCESH